MFNNKLLGLLFIILLGALRPGTNVFAQTTTKQQGLAAAAKDAKTNFCFILPASGFTLREDESIHPRLEPGFEIEISGTIQIPTTGDYRFFCDAPVEINGTSVNNRQTHLTSGQHNIIINVNCEPGADRFLLEWESGNFVREPVPHDILALDNSTTVPTQNAELFERGMFLFKEFDCAACHETDSDFKFDWLGPDFSGIGSRLNQNWLFHWLENPTEFQTNAAMPQLLDTSDDRADVAAYLAQLTAPPLLPNNSLFNPQPNQIRITRGEELYNNTGCTACHNDDSFPLSGLGAKWNPATLARYLYAPMEIEPSGRMPGMQLSPAEATIIAEFLSQSTLPAFEEPAPSGNPTRGREIIADNGCLNCHSLPASEQLTNNMSAPALNALSPSKGCLAESPPTAAPSYTLDAGQRKALSVFIADPGHTPAPVQFFSVDMEFFRCNTCHDIFKPATVDLDETPPPLTGSGFKLRESWLEQVLCETKRIRPWLKLRMPEFGVDNMSPLVPKFAATTGAEHGEGAVIPKPTQADVSKGIQLIGRGFNGFSCINCHDFKGVPGKPDTRGPDMTEFYDRLKADWIRRWLHDPPRILPETPMPRFFNELPPAMAETMIDNLRAALWAGDNMPVPTGLENLVNGNHIVVGDQPVVIRAWMPGASPSSIAVGLTEQQSFCFDTSTCRLMYAWRGGFLDMENPKTGARNRQPDILGVEYYSPPNTFPFRLETTNNIPAFNFKGYQITNGTPVFLYQMDNIKVREQITPAAEGLGIKRTFHLDSVNTNTWFITGVFDDLTLTPSIDQTNDGILKIPQGANVSFSTTIQLKL
ncbi:MAG: c-type cytochrome [Verrucomicrobia bacterium]|nr:c-type cytochrome [Verrucomicrobiota bacterium]MCF7708928.1 c-type cytochrome [Verrucomicrobiota bacterium]